MQYIIWLDGVLFYATNDKADADEYIKVLKKLGMNYELEERIL